MKLFAGTQHPSGVPPMPAAAETVSGMLRGVHANVADSVDEHLSQVKASLQTLQGLHDRTLTHHNQELHSTLSSLIAAIKEHLRLLDERAKIKPKRPAPESPLPPVTADEINKLLVKLHKQVDGAYQEQLASHDRLRDELQDVFHEISAEDLVRWTALFEQLNQTLDAANHLSGRIKPPVVSHTSPASAEEMMRLFDRLLRMLDHRPAPKAPKEPPLAPLQPATAKQIDHMLTVLRSKEIAGHSGLQAFLEELHQQLMTITDEHEECTAAHSVV